MKRLRIGLLVALCILTAALCGIFVYGMTGHNIYRGIKNREYTGIQLVLEKEISGDEIDSILISNKVCSNDIYIYESETDTITVKEYSEFKLTEDEISTVKVNNGRLEVAGKRKNQIGYYRGPVSFAGGKFYTELWLPESYHGEISLEAVSGDIIAEPAINLAKDFKAQSISGDISLPVLTAKNISISSTSGYIKTETIHADDNGSNGAVRIATTSGDINLKQVTGELNLRTTSGYTTMETLSGDGQFSTTSGDITIQHMGGSAVISTTSGDTTIQYMDGSAAITTTSGNISIHEGNGDRNVTSTSGDVFAEEFDGNFDISATSGDVIIKARSGAGAIETISGDIQLELEELKNKLTINSNSGHVDIRLSEKNAFEFEASTTSGDINTFFDNHLNYSKKGNQAQGTYGSNVQGGLIDIETTSGDIQITQLR